MGVAQSTPSHANSDTGRPSTSSTMSSSRAQFIFSTIASLSAQVRPSSVPFWWATTSTVMRSSTR